MSGGIEDWQEEKASSGQIGGSHYLKYPIQPAYFCWINKVPSIEAQVIGYVMRHRDKNGLEDLKKARQYIDLLIEWEYSK